MSLSRQRLELKKKLEGKLVDDAPVKKEQKRVSKLVIPQMFAFSNSKNTTEEKPKSLNTSLSKSTGNLSSNSTRTFSTSIYKSNSIQIEDKPEILSRDPFERKLSSKSFSIHSPTENVTFDDIKLNTRPKSFIQNARSSNTLGVCLDSSSNTNTAVDSTDVPVIVASIRKNSLSESSTVPDEFKEIVNLVRSPKPPNKKEETVMHFNFADKSDSFKKQGTSENVQKTADLNRSESRNVILVPEDNDIVIKKNLKEDLENEVSTAHNPKEEYIINERIEENNNFEHFSVNETEKKFDRKDDEIYVNFEVIRKFYDSTTKIKFGPIGKKPLPSIRYSLIRN